MPVLIRPATSADIPQMCALLGDLFSIEADFSRDCQRQVRGLMLLINDISGRSAVFVAEDAGEIAGMCSVQTLVSTAEGGPVGLIEDLVIRREYRRKGIATELLSEIIRWCGEKNLTRLQLLRDIKNGDAHKFYVGNGWSDTSLLCMRKMLR